MSAPPAAPARQPDYSYEPAQQQQHLLEPFLDQQQQPLAVPDAAAAALANGAQHRGRKPSWTFDSYGTPLAFDPAGSTMAPVYEDGPGPGATLAHLVGGASPETGTGSGVESGSGSGSGPGSNSGTGTGTNHSSPSSGERHGAGAGAGALPLEAGPNGEQQQACLSGLPPPLPPTPAHTSTSASPERPVGGGAAPGAPPALGLEQAWGGAAAAVEPAAVSGAYDTYGGGDELVDGAGAGGAGAVDEQEAYALPPLGAVQPQQDWTLYGASAGAQGEAASRGNGW